MPKQRFAVFVFEAPEREAMMWEAGVILFELVSTMHNADRMPSLRFVLRC
jgi:hypothetical protein